MVPSTAQCPGVLTTPTTANSYTYRTGRVLTESETAKTLVSFITIKKNIEITSKLKQEKNK